MPIEIKEVEVKPTLSNTDLALSEQCLPMNEH
jgi:hypothetical protein